MRELIEIFTERGAFVGTRAACRAPMQFQHDPPESE
jgi:hypothetical protein